MSLTDTEWVDRLRAQVEPPPVDVDVPLALRRGRRRRTVRRSAAVLAPVAVLAAAALVWPSQPFLQGPQVPLAPDEPTPASRSQTAFVASPLTTLSSAAAEASTADCRASAARRAQFHAENDLLDRMLPEDLPALVPVVTQQREQATLTVLASSDWLTLCLTRVRDDVGVEAELPAPPAPDAVEVVDYADEQLGAVHAALIVGRYGTDVASVQITRGNGEPVQATLREGLLVAWWPTERAEDVEVVARLTDGRTVSAAAAAPATPPEG
jgi:hypothetical protein